MGTVEVLLPGGSNEQQQLPQTRIVSMENLRVGDRVLTASGKYETVYAYGHFDEQKETQYIQFQTKSTGILEMTNDHLVYVQGKSRPVKAGSVRVGDVLLSRRSSSNATTTMTDGVVPVIVEEIFTVVRKGLYAPLTV